MEEVDDDITSVADNDHADILDDDDEENDSEDRASVDLDPHTSRRALYTPSGWGMALEESKDGKMLYQILEKEFKEVPETVLSQSAMSGLRSFITDVAKGINRDPDDATQDLIHMFTMKLQHAEKNPTHVALGIEVWKRTKLPLLFRQIESECKLKAKISQNNRAKENGDKQKQKYHPRDDNFRENNNRRHYNPRGGNGYRGKGRYRDDREEW